MKPVALEFKGINSFSEHTIIDFASLTHNGIFGIFGDTGSGKSTILDCINFALYGNVERSRFMTDIINYRSDSAKVKFVFDILNGGKRRTYTVERTIKKDKSGTHKAMLYEKDESGEACIADKPSAVEKKIVEILGVEAEDFRKCIALPQGEFAQFVKSAPRDRLALIERLFSLSRYGDRLKEKLSLKQSLTEGEYQNLSGILKTYDDATEERLNEVYSGVKAKSKLLEDKIKAEKKITDKFDKLKALAAKRAELEETEAKLNAALSQKEEIEGLRKDLTALPACVNVLNTDGEISAKLEYITGLTAKISEFESRISEKSNEIEYLENQLKKENLDDGIAECIRLQTLYEANASVTQKLDALTAKLNEKRKEYRKKEEEKIKLEADKRKAANESERAQRELSDLGGSDLSSFINGRLKGALLKEEYSYSLDYFATLKGNVKVFKEDSPLYNYISGELDGKIKEYTGRVLDLKDFSVAELNGQLDKLQSREKIREEKQRAVNFCNERLQGLNAAVEIKVNELKISAKEGSEIKGQIEELTKETEKIFGDGCRDINTAIRYNGERLKNLKALKENLTKKSEAAKSEKKELELNLERDMATRTAQTEERARLLNRLDGLLKASGQESVEGCRATVARFEKLPDAERTIKEYDAKLAALTARAEELKNTDGISGFSAEEYEAAEAEKSTISREIQDLTGEIAVLNREGKELEVRLREKEKYLEDFSKLERERNLIAMLREATKNNKFMEFIANEYLYDVSRLSSTTLLKLTDGRYFLTYKDNNFSVGDNFDCGNLRGVNTLSGGETFLVSLSLALALSQTICARSLKNIEFFFLDEGFGTLDSSLVDTVMNALEKLKSSYFTIGVISHVEELKHRIESKIIVNKATETHGSTVTVSC